MADQLEERLSGAFDVLDDVEVPELWEHILTRSDTERDEPQRPRPRWTALAAAAVLVALAGVGVVAVAVQDDGPQGVDAIDAPDAAVANTVRLAVDDDGVSVGPTAIAGWVTFDVANRTDQLRGFSVRRLLPGTTYDDVRTLAELPPPGDATAADRLLAEADVTWWHGPGDAHAVGVPLVAGDYVVLSFELDERLQGVPGTFRDHRFRVDPGAAGRPPTPTITYQIIGGTIIGPTTTPAGRTTIAIDDGDEAPRKQFVADLRDGVTHAAWDRWGRAQLDGEATWHEAPADSIIGLLGAAAGRTVTLEVDAGPIGIMAAHDLDEATDREWIWVEVG